MLSLNTLLHSASFLITYVILSTQLAGKYKVHFCLKSISPKGHQLLLGLSSYQEHQLNFLETMQHLSAHNRDILPCSDMLPLPAGFSPFLLPQYYTKELCRAISFIKFINDLIYNLLMVNLPVAVNKQMKTTPFLYPVINSSKLAPMIVPYSLLQLIKLLQSMQLEPPFIALVNTTMASLLSLLGGGLICS